MKACWCASLFQLQQQRSCVWYSVGGIHCSALKFMDQRHWLLSTAAFYDIVTPVPLTISAAFSIQLLRLQTSALTVSGLLKMRRVLNAVVFTPSFSRNPQKNLKHSCVSVCLQSELCNFYCCSFLAVDVALLPQFKMLLKHLLSFHTQMADLCFLLNINLQGHGIFQNYILLIYLAFLNNIYSSWDLL